MQPGSMPTSLPATGAEDERDPQRAAAYASAAMLQAAIRGLDKVVAGRVGTQEDLDRLLRDE